MQSPFSTGWWSFDLGKFRPCGGTYSLYEYEGLPPIDESLLIGRFNNWLTPAGGRGARGPSRALAGLASAAAKARVRLPLEFLTFMGDAALQAAVPSCTACEWDPSRAPIPCRVVPGAFTVRFLRDQQDCLFWYLHALPDGDVHVICSPIPFDEPEVEVSRAAVIANTWYCAPSFERFVYRFWIENVVWFAVNSREPRLTPAQLAYVSHYDAAAASELARRAADPTQVTAQAESEKAAKRAASEQAAERTASKQAAKKATGKTVASKKVGKTAAKRTASKKVAKKATGKTVASKKVGKTAAKQTASKKVARKAAKRTASKKVAKTAAKRTVSKKATGKTVASKKVGKTAAKRAGSGAATGKTVKSRRPAK